MEEHYEFDEATLFSAFAMGAPGKRTFFLLIGQKEHWIRVWLEKEQLETLGLAIDQFLYNLSQQHVSLARGKEGATLSDEVPSGMPAAEIGIDQITLGFDRERAMLNLSGYVLGPKREEQAVLDCRATLAQLKKLGDQAKSICAAGRPRCVLCGGPIDPTGHICPRNN